MTLLIEIQYCKNCALHSWCSHHDEVKYIDFYEQLAKKIAQHLPQAKVVQRKPSEQLVLRKIQANDGAMYMNTETGEPVHFPRLGSFEIYVDGVRIFSKIKSKLWPKFDNIVEKLKNINKAKGQGRSLVAFDIDQDPMPAGKFIRNQDRYDIRAIFRVRKSANKDETTFMHQTSGRQGFRQRELQRSLDANKQVNQFNPQASQLVFEQAYSKNDKEGKRWLEKWNLAEPSSKQQRERKANVYLQQLYPRTQSRRRKLVISKIDSNRILLENEKGQKNIYRKQSQKQEDDRNIPDSGASDARASSRRNNRRKLAPIPPVQTNAKINSLEQKQQKDEKYQDLYDELNLSAQQRQKLENKSKQVCDKNNQKPKGDQKGKKISQNDEYQQEYEQLQHSNQKMSKSKEFPCKEEQKDANRKQQKKTSENKKQSELKNKTQHKQEQEQEIAHQEKYSNQFMNEQVEQQEPEQIEEKDNEEKQQLQIEEIEQNDQHKTKVQNIKLSQEKNEIQEQEKIDDQVHEQDKAQKNNQPPKKQEQDIKNLNNKQTNKENKSEKKEEKSSAIMEQEKRVQIDLWKLDDDTSKYETMSWNSKMIQGQFHLIAVEENLIVKDKKVQTVEDAAHDSLKSQTHDKNSRQLAQKEQNLVLNHIEKYETENWVATKEEKQFHINKEGQNTGEVLIENQQNEVEKYQGQAQNKKQSSVQQAQKKQQKLEVKLPQNKIQQTQKVNQNIKQIQTGKKTEKSTSQKIQKNETLQTGGDTNLLKLESTNPKATEMSKQNATQLKMQHKQQENKKVEESHLNKNKATNQQSSEIQQQVNQNPEFEKFNYQVMKWDARVEQEEYAIFCIGAQPEVLKQATQSQVKQSEIKQPNQQLKMEAAQEEEVVAKKSKKELPQIQWDAFCDKGVYKVVKKQTDQKVQKV